MLFWTFDFERKKIRGFSFGPLEYQKKITSFQKHWKKKDHTGELHKKRHNFAPGAANHTFFLTNPVCIFIVVTIYCTPAYIYYSIYILYTYICMLFYLYIVHPRMNICVSIYSNLYTYIYMYIFVYICFTQRMYIVVSICCTPHCEY